MTQDQVQVAWRDAALQQQVPRSASSDANFLIQATFGPTRETLQELAGLTYEQWITQQMSLPAEQHRTHYRERANPRQFEPLPAGLVRSRCAEGSRWHSFAVERSDRNKRIEVRGGKVWVDGELRTEIDPQFVGNGLARPRCSNEPLSTWRNSNGVLTRNCTSQAPALATWECSSEAFLQQGACAQACFDLAMPLNDADCSTGWVDIAFDGFVCDAVDAVGGLLRLSSGSSCAGTQRVMRNPAVWLARPPSSTATPRRFRGVRPGVLLLAESPANCDFGDIVQVEGCSGGTAGVCQPGQLARHSARLDLLHNTPEAPLASQWTAATLCPTVRRNPFNIGSCRVQQACTPGWTTPVNIALTPSNLGRLANLSGRQVYSVAGLVAARPPCRQSSRWAALDCQATTGTRCLASVLSAAQAQAVQTALQGASGDLRDVQAACDDVPAGVVVQLGTTAFFQHVHPDEGNVYDLTDWAERDPAGAEDLLRFAVGNALRFPASFNASRWAAVSAQLAPALLGGLGRTVEFAVLPRSLQLPAVADAFQQRASPVYYEVCGSPGEVANDPSQGHWYTFASRVSFPLPGWNDMELELPPTNWRSRATLWLQKAMYGKDQLRQRMAWALSQIFVHGDDTLTNQMEGKLSFYDIFVRNAFGNFGDVVREVTYNPMMGRYLTYQGNKAFHVQGTYPDENYAREVMQLFTIGLWQLHPNGTRQRAANGEALPTYNNFHIQNFARVFTGLNGESARANIESYFSANLIDPMRMSADSHDRFPKTDLGDGYLGDGYPLCSDLPASAFLRQGARFEFAGFQPTGSSRDTFGVNVSSPLYQELCQPSTTAAPASGACNFRSVVQLQRSVACHGDQCSWELPRLLQVGNGYYEFVPPPCVRLFFFNGRQLLENGQVRDCADPGAVAGGVACCSGRSSDYPTQCVADSRDVRLSTAEARCAGLNMTTCGPVAAGQRLSTCRGRLWSNQTCRLSVAIDADGLVSPQTDAASRAARFPVVWAAGFPAPSAQSCANEGCSFANSSCICDATVETAAVFSQLPSEAQVRSLRVGAFPPTEPCTHCSGPVRVYSAGSRIDASTVFEVGGRFWRNLQSTVRVGRRQFRNPPNFMVPGSPRARDALNEVDAFLDLLVRHPSTPVFTSYRLIQRFGNSNPSARYLQDVAQAFRTGMYAGRTYSGRYGDLGATVAAILLHPEARAGSLAEAGALREPVLKFVHVLRSLEYRDRFGRPLFVNEGLAAAGQEPFLAPSVFNYYHFNFQPANFLQNASLRALVSPEFEVLDSSQMVASINGLQSAMANSGLSHCNGGFGLTTAGVSLSALPSRVFLCQQGDFLATGRLNATTAEAALNELSLLLTGGRLSPASMGTVRASYQADFSGPYYDARLGSPLPGSSVHRNLSSALAAALTDRAVGGVTQGRDGTFTLRVGTGSGPLPSTGEMSWVKKATPAAKLASAQAAIVLTPEFNTLGGRVGSNPLPPPASTAQPTPTSPKPYRALVQLYLAGGADTFQVIVPQDCPLYSEYLSVRGSIALTPSQLLPVTTANQTCRKFGVHNKLSFLTELYRSQEAAFVSNVGNLADPLVGRQEFLTGTKKRCVGLFSHEDQAKAAHTLICQSSAAAAQLGAGGRLADALATGYRTTSFSLVGRSAWSDGNKVRPRSLSASIGVPQILDIDGLQSAVSNITGRAYEGIYGEIYVRGLADTVSQSEEMGKVLDAVKLRTSFPRVTSLQQQFYQVARVIASRAERQAERDFFAVRIGGLDTHKANNPTLDKALPEIDDALKAFVSELKAQGVWNSTVVFTASDFGRTLTPNDNTEDAGTDHGWAGNQIILGGAIRGGQVFNNFPSALQQGSAMDVGRGRLIPQYPYESFMVPVAQWMGLSETQLGAAFPNLPNFNRTAHILATEALFKA